MRTRDGPGRTAAAARCADGWRIHPHSPAAATTHTKQCPGTPGPCGCARGIFGRHAAGAVKRSGGARRLLVTSRTSAWVVPPPKVVFYKEAPGAYAAKGCIARARSALSERSSKPSCGGCGAAGRFIRDLAHENRGARGRSRCRGWAQSGRLSESSRARREYLADDSRQEPTSGSSCGYWMGLAALRRARIPVDTHGCLTAHDCYRSKTGAALRRSCLASLLSCKGVATLALAENQCGKLYLRWNPDMLCSKECIVRPRLHISHRHWQLLQQQ